MRRRSAATFVRQCAVVAWVLPLILMLISCTSYRQKPLTAAAVDQALVPPAWPVLQLRVAEFTHPRLPPTTIAPDGPFRPEQLAVMAVVTNPGLRARRAERALAAAQLLQAGILPNPTLSLGADLAVSSPDGGETPGSSLGIGWDFTSLITRGAKRASAQAHADQVDLDVAWEEWLIAESAKQAAMRLVAAEQRLELTRAVETSLNSQRELVSAGSAVGIRSRQDEIATITAAADARRLTLENEQACVALRMQLNRLLGLPPHQVVVVQVPVWPTTLKLPVTLSDDLQRYRLDLIALRRGYDSQEEALRVAVLGQFPRISFELVHATDTGKVRTLTLGASIDLPLFDRNQGVIASETATRERLFAEYTQRVFEARSDLAEALAEATALMQRIAEADRVSAVLERHVQVVAQAEAAHTIDGFTAGELRSQMLQRRIEDLALRQQLAEVRVACELAAGLVLDSPADPPAKAPTDIPISKERP